MNCIRLCSGSEIAPKNQGVFLTSRSGQFRLGGSDVATFVDGMLPLLDGAHTAEDIAGSLPQYSRESVHAFLSMLESKGVVETSDRLGGAAAECEFTVPAGRTQVSALADAHLMVIGLEPWGSSAALQLAAAGIGKLSMVDDQAWSTQDFVGSVAYDTRLLGQSRAEVHCRTIRARVPRLHAVAAQTLPSAFSTPTAQPSLDLLGSAPTMILLAARGEELLLRYQVAAAAHRAGVPLVSAHMEGDELWISHSTNAQGCACWNCLRMRRLGHADQILNAHQYQAQLITARSMLAPQYVAPGVASVAGQVLGAELTELLCNNSVSLNPGRVRVHALAHGTATLHGVAQMPWCPMCGGADAVPSDKDARDTESSVGVLASNDLGSVLAKMEGWLDPRVGVIRSLDLKPAGPPLPLTSTTRICNFTEGDPTRVSLGAACGGKGVTAFQAQLGAIGEAIERYSAARYRGQDLHLAPMSALDGDVLDPRSLAHYASEVYESSENPYVRFDKSRAIHWVRGHWFGSQRQVWVPAAAVYFGLPIAPQEQLLQVTSNGLAAGASGVDAALRAVFELMERDAVMLTWLAQLPSRRIVVDRTLGSSLDEVAGHLRDQGVRLEFHLLEVGVQLPVVLCLGFGGSRCAPAVAASIACHGDLATAVGKALLEQAHVSPYLATIAAGRIPATPEAVRSLEDHALYYVGSGREAAFEFLSAAHRPDLKLSEAANHSFPGDPVAATEIVARWLSDAGLQVATIDVTAPDVRQTPFRVARAVGVNIQPIHFGYQLRPTENPRLRDFLGSRAINANPHPIA